MEQIMTYTAGWCGDCRRARQFLRERGVAFREVNIDGEPGAEGLVSRVNAGSPKVPTVAVNCRYFACRTYGPKKTAGRIRIPARWEWLWQ